MSARPVTVFLLAGEPSGDTLGAGLMASLRRRSPEPIRFIGVGGPKMAAAGLSSLYPMEDIAHFGVAELIPHLRLLLRRLRETVETIRTQRPDVVVTIDVPGFSLRVGARLHGSGIPLVHYVAPQVWAWKPHRAKQIARFLDHLLVLLPFEPPYFEVEGLPSTFVGHPVVESGAADGDGPGFRARHGIDPAAPLVCVLPGSRRGEIRRLLPVFAQAVARLAEGRPSLRVVVPAVDAFADEIAAGIAAGIAAWPAGVVVIRGEVERFDAFAAADVALAASGTVALELAMAGTPSVIAYRLNPITAWALKRAIKVRRVSLVNLLADDEIFPEVLQEHCRPERLATEVAQLLDDAEARARQRAGAARAVAMLSAGSQRPSDLAADAVLKVMEAHRAPRLTAPPAPPVLPAPSAP
jgi:lipid-A-disaccharide synthase